MSRTKLACFLFIGLFLGSILINNLNYFVGSNSITNKRETRLNDIPFQPILEVQDDVTENNLFGIGNDIPIGLYANITEKITLNNPYLEVPGYKYCDLQINTNYHNISQTNLTFSGVIAENSSYIIEDDPENFIETYTADNHVIWGAMSIKIPAPCKLKQIKLFVQEINETALWNITIFNATRDLSDDLHIIPDTHTGVSILQTATEPELFAAHWQIFSFPDVQLNITNTYVDARGFAYYFFIIIMPVNTTWLDHRVLYYSYDTILIDDGYAYFGLDYNYQYAPVDFCLKAELAPLSKTPNPADIGLSVKNPKRPSPINLSIEANHTIPVNAASNFTTGLKLLAQNFTLTDYGTVESISVYLGCFGDSEINQIGIFPDNESGIGPYWDTNQLYDMNTTFNLINGTEGWMNFILIDKPTLSPGKYWWVFTCRVGENVTLYGAPDATGNSAVALNITATDTGSGIEFQTEILPYDFATIIGFQPGKEFFNVSQSWLYDTHLKPDRFGEFHFQILTRWLGPTSFNVTYIIELENNQFIEPLYHAIYQQETIWWNLSIQPTFPVTLLGKIINVTIPLDWNVFNVTKNGQDHGASNWSLNLIENKRVISIRNASDDRWTLWCNSTKYSTDFTIKKLIQGQYQPAVNATVYDRLQVNITIANQTDGHCYLTVFYPNGESTFKNQTKITMENTNLSWFPENDSAATGGNYTFVVHWSNGTEVGYNRQYFLFTPIPANFTLTSGLPSPYVNDTSRSVIVHYNDSRGVNIAGATISANLNGISLEWEDIFSKTLITQDRGLYRVKLNTIGLNSGQNYNLSMWAYKEGYENITLMLGNITVLPVPTSLLPNIENITQYEGELISFSCSFKDTFHGLDIDWASVNYSIISTPITGQLTGIMPGESVYIAESVLLENLIGRVTPYQIQINASAYNCESNSTIINLFVLNKTKTSLTLDIGDGPFIQGRKMRIKATLINETSGFGIPNATIRFTFGDIILDQIAITDFMGIAEIEFSIPAEQFIIYAWFDATTSTAQSFDSQEVSIITNTDLALWIGLIIGVCVVAIIAFRQLYVVPKRKRREEEYRKIAQKFQDVANLRHILILHRASSGCLYQQSFGDELDGDLISGFLSAISSFQTELKPGKLPQKEVKTGGFELSYQDYKILLFHGEHISLALIYEETLSEQFRIRAQLFVQEYESTYHKFLVTWRGDITPFKTSYQFIAEKLEISLIWPHKLHHPGPTEKISSLEFSLIQIADTIMKSQVMEYFFLPLVISMGQAGLPQSKLEVIATVYYLRQRNSFVPFNPQKIND